MSDFIEQRDYERWLAKAEKENESLRAKLDDIQSKYDDLIYVVGNKHEGESRHETAKRYIINAENNIGGPVASKALAEINK